MASPMITPVTDDTSATNAAPPSPQQDAGTPPPQPAPQAAPAPAPAPTAAPAAPPQPGELWKNMLVGAMQGIAGAKGATSFGGGVAGGAANVIAQKQQAFENQQTQQQNTSINNFRDVQSAHMVAQTTAEVAALQNMPEDRQQAKDKLAQEMATQNQQNGWGTYTPISLKDPEAVKTYLNSQPDGASMPPGTITGATVAYVPTANSDAGSAFEQYKTLGPAFGMAALDRGSFLRMNPQQQAQQVRMVNNIAQGRKMDGSVYKPNELPQAIAQMTDLATKAKSTGNAAAAQTVTAALADLQNQLDASNKQADTTASKKLANSQALKATAGAGGAKADMVVGTAPDGSQVAGTAQELQAIGVKSITKLPAADQSKVVAARELTDPNAGLFHSIAADMKSLGPDQLGPAAGRWNEFMAGKVGDGPAFAKLRTDMGLLQTKLMQVHVGARGSEVMLEHFKNLADSGKMNYATLTNALAAEYNYVNEMAKRPKASYGGK
jgi:hypothetical protein